MALVYHEGMIVMDKEVTASQIQMKIRARTLQMSEFDAELTMYPQSVGLEPVVFLDGKLCDDGTVDFAPYLPDTDPLSRFTDRVYKWVAQVTVPEGIYDDTFSIEVTVLTDGAQRRSAILEVQEVDDNSNSSGSPMWSPPPSLGESSPLWRALQDAARSFHPDDNPKEASRRQTLQEACARTPEGVNPDTFFSEKLKPETHAEPVPEEEEI